MRKPTKAHPVETLFEFVVQHWSDRYSSFEMMQEIRRLAEREGLSASEIAKRIGYGTTKNMVMGLVHKSRPRIKLAGEGTKTRAYGKANSRAIVPAVRAPLKFSIIAEVFEPIHHDKLRPGDRRCRMPLWPDRIGTSQRPAREELIYCGQKTEENSSWCPACRAKVFEPMIARSPGKGNGRKYDRSGRRAGWEYGT